MSTNPTPEQAAQVTKVLLFVENAREYNEFCTHCEILAAAVRRLQAALAEKEEELEKLGEEFVAINGYADMHMKEKARRENLEAQLAASQQRVDYLETCYSGADAANRMSIARGMQAEVDRDRYQAALDCSALASVLRERERQNKKWGEQNHENPIWSAILAEECGEFAQACLHDVFGGSHAGTAREEAVHCAAVALQIVQCIDRKAALATPAAQAATNFAPTSLTHPACSEPGKPVKSGGEHQFNASDAGEGVVS